MGGAEKNKNNERVVRRPSPRHPRLNDDDEKHSNPQRTDVGLNGR